MRSIQPGRTDEGTTNSRPPLPEEAVELPLDGELDLHLFRPKDAADVVESYLEACREKGVLGVRIVHGKGAGVLRRRVHALLERLAYVESFRTAEDVSLRPK